MTFVEFEPAVKNNSERQPGRASIVQIIEASEVGRLTSKRTVKQLQFGHGLPGTRAQQQLLVERFNAFRTHTLKQYLSVPFSGDDILRFSDSIIGKLHPCCRDILEGEPKFENLRAHFKIEFSKGSKNVRNGDLDLYLRPLDDSRYRHMCTVSLLMIYALRHGLVVGSSIQEVVEHTANTVDGRVVWTFPHRPVLCAFTSGVRKCDLDKPAGAQQLLQSVKQMRVVSNILTRVYTHAIRLGAAQDVAHLPHSLGHTNNAFQKGITEAYAGSHTREFYNDRAKREFVHHWGAQFSEQSALGFIKKAVTEDEIRDWQD
ncbi:hypothetical protein V1524DRAFT_414929 [Lipomyces starkeyi]